jgi:uncharacterized protein (DUF433 family)
MPNLTKSIKEFLVNRFANGATIKECAMWYEQKPERIEDAIREALKEALEQKAAPCPSEPQ